MVLSESPVSSSGAKAPSPGSTTSGAARRKGIRANRLSQLAEEAERSSPPPSEAPSKRTTRSTAQTAPAKRRHHTDDKLGSESAANSASPSPRKRSKTGAKNVKISYKNAKPPRKNGQGSNKNAKAPTKAPHRKVTAKDIGNESDADDTDGQAPPTALPQKPAKLSKEELEKRRVALGFGSITWLNDDRSPKTIGQIRGE